MKKLSFWLYVLLPCTCLAQNLALLNNNCKTPSSEVELNINNVRTTLLNGGDMWWNGDEAKYEVPKGGGVNSMFTGNIWIGAKDENGLIKTAATVYRGYGWGTDYWPGPIDNDTLINQNTCSKYDQHYSVLRSDVLAHLQAFENNELDNYIIPQSIINWPGNHHENLQQTLAPFEDVNNNGIYEPELGEYPAFNLDKSKDCRNGNTLMGDQSVWWVMNDVGNKHEGSQSSSVLGAEVHAQAFAIASDDALNNTTFYQYKIINRSSNPYYDVYFGVYTDSDLGNYQDDYIGCHVSQGLGYTYNGDSYDDGWSNQYTAYKEHPPAIGLDYLQGPIAKSNDGKDNDFDGEIDEVGEELRLSTFMYLGDIYNNEYPFEPSAFYNYLRGHWVYGNPLTYGSWGYYDPNPDAICHYMLSDGTDPDFPPSEWEPWTEFSDSMLPSNRRFISSTGPFDWAPGGIHIISTALVWSQDLEATENPHLASLEKLLVDDQYIQEAFDGCFETKDIAPIAGLYSYREDSIIIADCESNAIQFNFPEQSTLIHVEQIHWYFGDGNSSGEFNPYHIYQEPGTYEVLLYVSNEFGSDYTTFTIDIPCRLIAEALSVEISRLDGTGNDNNFLELKEESLQEILLNYSADIISFKSGRGPFQISIIDPLTVKEGEYELKCIDIVGSKIDWALYSNLDDDTLFFSSTQEQILNKINTKWGFNLQAGQQLEPGQIKQGNGAIGINIQSDETSNWLNFIQDRDSTIFFESNELRAWTHNWIRSGKESDDLNYIDPDEFYETAYSRKWAPYRLLAREEENFPHGLAWSLFQSESQLKDINNVDIVFTQDKSLWTRVPVVETGDSIAIRLNLKQSPSVDKEGLPDGTGFGFSWFPGYAIDLDKGIRLNMMFGEASELLNERGNDMMWNPTENILLEDTNLTVPKALFGGRHYIYINKSQYQGEIDSLHPHFENLTFMESNSKKRKVYTDISWCSIPIITNNTNFLKTDVIVQLRVNRPFDFYESGLENRNNGLPYYKFNIDKNDYYPEIKDSKGFLLFPNPSSEQIILLIDNDELLSLRAQIYSSDGRLVIETAKLNYDYIEIDVSDLSSGIYYCRLLGNEEILKTKPFFKL